MTQALLLALLVLSAAPARAEDDAFRFYREEASVVTATRRPEPAWRAPAAVDVVTAEDLKAYGFRNLWDALRYRVGMDVVDGSSLDGNRALVSARGFTREFVAEMQVLVDGRPVYSPLLGGVYWESLPVQLQDIERIEIVRGPNAVLYGSNAGLGVVNIITKKPAAATRARATAWGGSRGGVGTAEGVSLGGPRGALRVSHEHREEPSDPSSTGGGSANDFLRLDRLNLRARRALGDATEAEAFGGGSWMTAGLPGLATDPQSRHREDFESVRVTRRLDDEGAVEADLTHSDGRIVNEPDPATGGPVATRLYQYDVEFLHRFFWDGGRVSSNWGADWRLLGAYSDQAFSGGPAKTNHVVRAYTHHAVRLTDAVRATGGVSVENSDTGGTQPAWQAALLWSPDEEHALRLSYSLAPTLPPLFDKSADYRLSATKKFVGNPDLEPQKISSWEAGWNGRFLRGSLRPSLSVYYMEVRDRLFNYVSGTSGGVTTISTDNRNRAIARGVETSLEYRPAAGRALFANYAYERITDRSGPGALGNDVEQNTPRHKVNLGGRTVLPGGFSAAAALAFKDAYGIASASRGTTVLVPSSWRLDARLSWSPRRDWELFVAGSSLLGPLRLEYADGALVPRIVRGGATARFGL
jgi:iron complex outermembrane receptor protein